MEISKEVRIGEKLKALWHWWLDEMLAVMPEPITDFFSAEAQVLCFRADNNVFQIDLRTKAGVKSLGQFDPQAESIESLRSLLDEQDALIAAKPRVEITLPESMLVHRTIILPLATEKSLHTVVQHEIDKFMPFAKSKVYFGYKVLQRHPEQDKLSIALFATDREALGSIVQAIREVDLKPSALIPSSDKIGCDIESINMLPPGERAVAESLWSSEARRASLTAVALAIAVMLLPYWFLEHSASELQRELEAVKSEAMHVAEKRGLIMSHMLAKQAIVRRKNQTPATLELLLELTRLVPNNTWVKTLRIQNGKVIAEGESRKASDLIELLEASDLFSNAKFRSPITSNPKTNMEQYEIEMDLKGGLI